MSAGGLGMCRGKGIGVLLAQGHCREWSGVSSTRVILPGSAAHTLGNSERKCCFVSIEPEPFPLKTRILKGEPF